MDLTKDFVSLTGTVGHVPGLSMACSLAVQIIQTVQVSLILPLYAEAFISNNITPTDI